MLLKYVNLPFIYSRKKEFENKIKHIFVFFLLLAYLDLILQINKRVIKLYLL
jgi:hypothetical protein